MSTNVSPNLPSVNQESANQDNEAQQLRLVILQRVCPEYRLPVFRHLSATAGIEMTLVIGEDLPNSKVKSAPNLSGIRVNRLKTKFFRLGSRIVPLHIGLIGELRRLKPDVIFCEGESHFVGYVQAMLYRLLFNRRVGLMHWSFISLPGQTNAGRRLREFVKAVFRRFFDAFIVYSSFSKNCLLEFGEPSEKIFVATNVGDTRKYLALDRSISETPEQARAELGLPEKFTVIYIGTLDPVKRPEVLLELAKRMDPNCYSFVLLGTGSMLEELKTRAAAEGLSNVYLPGRVGKELPLYCRASNALIIPGRGGIVISEVMAMRLPVIVHEADGTEYDLVQSGQTGLRLRNGQVEDFVPALEYLRNNPRICQEMGGRAQELVAASFTLENVAEQIAKGAYFARERRRKLAA